MFFKTTTTDSEGSSQSRISTTAAGFDVEAIAYARLDIAKGQWRASVRLPPPPVPQEGWTEETFDAVSTLIPMACSEARRLLLKRTNARHMHDNALGSPATPPNANGTCHDIPSQCDDA